MHQQLWGYKVEDKLYLGVREQKILNTAGIYNCSHIGHLKWHILLLLQIRILDGQYMRLDRINLFRFRFSLWTGGGGGGEQVNVS
jgi:hypothetical protein